MLIRVQVDNLHLRDAWQASLHGAAGWQPAVNLRGVGGGGEAAKNAVRDG